MIVGLIGNGYWGKIWHKTLTSMTSTVDSVDVVTHDYKSLIDKSNIQCIIIATPAETHFQIAKDCLEAGKHILVEKPFVTNSAQTKELRDLAEKNNLIVMIGHEYLFNDGILRLKKLIDDDVLGEIKTYYSHRMSSGNYANALWEMG